VWPPADVTFYTLPKCDSGFLGLLEQTYPNIEANKCYQPDKSLIDLLKSAKAELVEGTQIPVPAGYHCRLVLHETDDCREGGMYALPNNRLEAGFCVTPLSTHIYPIKGFVWECM
jgi:hypothetical protein